MRNNLDDYKDERLEEFVRTALPEYDIICLFEIFSAFSARQNKLIAAARRQGFRYYHAATAKSIFSADGSIFLLISAAIPIFNLCFFFFFFFNTFGSWIVGSEPLSYHIN